MGILGLTAIAFFTSTYGWPIYLEVFSHFQLQYWAIAIVGLVMLVLTRHRSLFLIGLACTALLSTQLVTWYWPPKFLTANADSNLRVLIANINTQNKQYADVLAFAQQEQPDIALFMEVDDAWISQLNTLQGELPYTSGEGNPYNSGIVIYSRYPLPNTAPTSFEDQSSPSIVGQAVINGQAIAFVGTHPWPPVRPSVFHSRNRQLDQIGQYLQTVEAPQLVMGDLNLSMWSPYYKRFIRQTGLKNVRKGFGLLPSWPTSGTYRQFPDWASLFFSIPIDHCLVSPELQVVDVRTGPNVGSDHRPVIVDLRV